MSECKEVHCETYNLRERSTTCSVVCKSPSPPDEHGVSGLVERNELDCAARVDDCFQTKLVWCMELLSETKPIFSSSRALIPSTHSVQSQLHE